MAEGLAAIRTAPETGGVRGGMDRLRDEQGLCSSTSTPSSAPTGQPDS
ncbi:hypothetical protein [Streptomyces amritsarensis]